METIMPVVEPASCTSLQISVANGRELHEQHMKETEARRLLVREWRETLAQQEAELGGIANIYYHYKRDGHGRKRGVVVGFLNNNGDPMIGWALCNRKEGDTFIPAQGKSAAITRAVGMHLLNRGPGSTIPVSLHAHVFHMMRRVYSHMTLPSHWGNPRMPMRNQQIRHVTGYLIRDRRGVEVFATANELAALRGYVPTPKKSLSWDELHHIGVVPPAQE